MAKLNFHPFLNIHTYTWQAKFSPYNMILLQWHIAETSVTHQAVCESHVCLYRYTLL